MPQLHPPVRPFAEPFGWPNVFNPMRTGPAIEDVWPTLYIGVDRVPEMQRKIEQCDWAARALERWKAEAELVLAERPHFIEGATGGRCNLYTETGHHLLPDPLGDNDTMWDPFEIAMIEPRPGTRGGWVVLQHERVRRLMANLALLWKLTGDERYSQWVWEGLRELTKLYAAALQSRRSKAGPVYGHLYEAQAMLQVVQALEAVDGAPGATDSDRAALIENVLVASCDALASWLNVMMVFNMSCWGAAALAVAGRFLDRADWRDKAFHDERCGLDVLLKKGVPVHGPTGEPDGFWFEHSHFYACLYAPVPLVALYEEARRAGQASAEAPMHIASFFDAPPHLADQTLRILSISDRTGPGMMRLTQMSYFYEYAAGQIDARHAGLLSLLYARSGSPRASMSAVAMGPDALPEPAAPETLRKSCVLPEAQLVTFRAPTPRGEATLWFNNLKRYPGSAQGHHHMDRLSISLHAFGEIISSDLGWPGTETDDARINLLSGTMSHNTLMLNELDQGAIETVEFEAHVDDAIPWARGAFRGASKDGIQKTFRGHHHGRLEDGLYDDAVLRRTIWFQHPYIVLLDELTADSDKRLGFVFHSRGQMVARAHGDPQGSPLSMPQIPHDGAWSLFQGRTSADPVSLLFADWRIRSDLFLRMVSSGDGPFDATWGHTPDNPAEIRRGTVVLRGSGRRRQFATALELHESTPTISSVELVDSNVHVRRYDAEALVFGAER